MTTNMAPRKALVIGATGGVGGAIAERLVAGGWQVRALNRDPETARGRGPKGLEWVAGDAMVEADVVAAAEGCDLVVHGANPPAYKNWAGLQMPMLASAIAAAKAAGARLVFPGTVYNYGPDAFPNLTEASPQHPLTRKGAIRVRMEEALARASEEDGLKVLIVRCGDFFGPKPGVNGWLNQGLVQSGKPIGSVRYPGPLEIAHSWAYLPDIAETVVRLLELPDLGRFEAFHMRGHTQTGAEFVAGLETAAGRALKVTPLPWFAVRLMGAFNETMREMVEMHYLWEEPVLLDNARLVARLGAEPHTPLAQALRTALAGMDALPQTQAQMAA